ncbi:hypothetical protein [Sphingopyxis granuli]|uniref:hypothetical protein n=1 Tax=Sphingopyxis granuli TaxID=267128 RepID=UPI00301BC912
MLQINSGKLFTADECRTNALTGILYSNGRLPNDAPFATEAGTIRGTGFGPTDAGIVYELEERIEGSPENGALISHGVQPYLQDFAIVASFVLGVVVDPSIDVVRSLTSGKPGFASYDKPGEYVARFFEPRVFIQLAELEGLAAFMTSLIALERKYFLGVMRAMRTFTAGLHAIADDLGLAYTLLVSAGESLAQDFDRHETDWSHVDERKRVAVDKALARAAPSTRGAVRKAIVDTEHASLGRRYRAFLIDHIGDAYFRREGEGRHIPRFELEEALKQAYGFRSAFIHRSQRLPDPLRAPYGHWETTSVERRPVLTFQGLANLTREAIFEFVRRSPRIEREAYRYQNERAGIIVMQIAPQHWVFQPLGHAKFARGRVEGVLSLVASMYKRETGAGMVDLRSVLAEVEQMLPRAAKTHRPALLALHFLYNFCAPDEYRSEGHVAFREAHFPDFSQPTSEVLVTATAVGWTWTNSLADHRAMIDRYFAERVRPKGLHAPRLFEAAMWLDLSERHRAAGDHNEARILVANAIETLPSEPALRALEADYAEDREIRWFKLLCPPPPAPDEAPVSESPAAEP